MSSEISVVIPTLCRASLPDAVRSVLEQSLAAEEIIVVDNGPIHMDARTLLDEANLPQNRTRVISLPPYSGPAMPRNVGVWESQGDYIAFLDDDDRFAPEYLWEMVRQAESTGAELLVGVRVHLDEHGIERRRTQPQSVPAERWLEFLLQGGNPGVGGTNLVVKRDAFLRVGGFPVSLTSGQDRAFVMAALRAGQHLGTVDKAEVLCFDPVGFRATGHFRNVHNNVRIMHTHWDIMTWRMRWRHARMILARGFRTLRRERRQRKAMQDPTS